MYCLFLACPLPKQDQKDELIVVAIKNLSIERKTS